jgi:hypothetical protein
VLALEAPYRECVILRWFEGLPARAIAELRSLPERTVQVDHGDGRVGGSGAAPSDANGRFRLLVPAGVPVDLLAADWTRVAERASAMRLVRVQGVEPGTSDLTIRIDS